MSACSLVAPQATLIQYDPADGVGADLGTVKVRDVQALLGESGAVNVMFYVVNAGDEAAKLSVAVGEGGIDGTTTLNVPAGFASTVGGVGDTAKVIIEEPADARLGGLLPVYFQVGQAEGTQLQVPVLDASYRPERAPSVP